MMCIGSDQRDASFEKDLSYKKYVLFAFGLKFPEKSAKEVNPGEMIIQILEVRENNPGKRFSPNVKIKLSARDVNTDSKFSQKLWQWQKFRKKSKRIKIRRQNV